jgi:two-component system cell cycle response regulator
VRKVLVVEDDETIQKLMAHVLSEQGYAVVGVADGPSALPAARAERPDVILLDLGLPGLDGFGVLDQLKADPDVGGVPVLIVTAWEDSGLVSRALDQGAHDYVRKPFGRADLVARVESALRLKVATDELTGWHTRLTVLAHQDPLTGLPNRHHLVEALERTPEVSVVLADIDHFSAINNSHGHEVGDAVLSAVARRLRKRARAEDVVGRWGGEEFLIVARDTDLGGAGALAEDLRATLAGRAFAGLRLTASFGVAERAAGESPAALIARADAALYAAKRGGRDAVRLAQCSGASSSRTIPDTGIGTQSGRLLSS